MLTWKDCLDYSPAWDTLMWFAILISMSNGLNESGIISSFAGMVGDQLNALNLGWQVRRAAACILAVRLAGRSCCAATPLHGGLAAAP